MTEPRQPMLFVSHPSTKAETATHIERALNARGVRCWIAPRDVEPGEQWDVSIRRAIAETDAMLLLFCADSEKSRQVKRELILADQSDKPIIPMRLERIEPLELSYHLADSQWIDWIEQRDEAIDRIAVKAREFQTQRSLRGGGGPSSDFMVPQPPESETKKQEPKNLLWLWIGLGVVAAAAIGFAIWWFALRGPSVQVTEDWFAGVWADDRACTTPYRFDRGGSLTLPDARTGTWSIQNGNLLVMQVGGDTERRTFTQVVGADEIVSSAGRAYRCFSGAT